MKRILLTLALLGATSQARAGLMDIDTEQIFDTVKYPLAAGVALYAGYRLYNYVNSPSDASKRMSETFKARFKHNYRESFKAYIKGLFVKGASLTAYHDIKASKKTIIDDTVKYLPKTVSTDKDTVARLNAKKRSALEDRSYTDYFLSIFPYFNESTVGEKEKREAFEELFDEIVEAEIKALDLLYNSKNLLLISK